MFGKHRRSKLARAEVRNAAYTMSFNGNMFWTDIDHMSGSRLASFTPTLQNTTHRFALRGKGLENLHLIVGELLKREGLRRD